MNASASVHKKTLHRIIRAKLTYFNDATKFHHVIQISFVVLKLGSVINGDTEFAGSIMLRPKHSEYILPGNLNRSLEAELTRININAQWNRFEMVHWIATDLNSGRVKIFDVDTAFHPILKNTTQIDQHFQIAW